MKKIAFLHIPKCGGSTIRSMLSEIVPIHRQYPVPVGDSSKKEGYRIQKATVLDVMSSIEFLDLDFDLFMGNYDWQIVSAFPNDIVILTMLRNPVEQLYSQFRNFWMDTRRYGVLKDRYEYSGFEGFLDSMDVHRFANQQTRFLGGRYWGHQANNVSKGVLTSAKRNLRKSSYGLIGQWDSSITLFGDAIGSSLSIVNVENRNDKFYPKELSTDIVAKAESIQSYDMSLYEYAQKNFKGKS